MPTLIRGIFSQPFSSRPALGGLRGLWRALRNEHRRRDQLLRLMERDDHLLRDIGLTRHDVQRVLATPFWRR